MTPQPPPTRDQLATRYFEQLEYEPYPVQEEALLAWFTSEQGVLVCAPTGMGKTLIAEAAVFEALHTGKAAYAPRAIPAVVFTDPEVAWCGLTEDEARRAGLSIRTGVFPWQASGRAAILGRPEGLTKLVVDADGGRVLGMGVTGYGAGELIGEGVLAVEMGAVAEDLALTIHAHPSLSETIMEAAQRLVGQSTHFFQRT